MTATASHRRQRAAFSLIELLMVVGIIALLASMLLPVIAQVRERAKRVVCAANLKSLTLATFGYLQDNNGFLMPGGPYNNAGFKPDWYSSTQLLIQTYLVNASQANSSASAARPFRFVHCPANPTARNYAYCGGQPYDFPATLERLSACAKRWKAPGDLAVLWADNCTRQFTGQSDFNDCCNHQGERSGPTSGTPLGGNCSFTDGSVAWLPWRGDVTVGERAFIINGGSIGGAMGIPNCVVLVRMDSAGMLDTSRWDNLTVGRSNLVYAGNF